MSSEPSVSCLMVTSPGARRLGYAKRAISDYCAQTYPSRELVIVQDEGPAEFKSALKGYVAELARDDIVVLDAPEAMSLGALRNLSRREAGGAIHCQWDDDDLYHATRIERQLAALRKSGTDAICLKENFQYFPASREIYWTNWRRAPLPMLPGSIMCLAEMSIAYPETGETAQRAEDTALCERLLAQGETGAPCRGSPHLLVYVSHGANTWDAGHHARLARLLGAPAGQIRQRKAWISAHLAAFDFGPGPLAVRGPDGVAFTLGDGER